MRTISLILAVVLSVATCAAQEINVNVNAPHCVININGDSARVTNTNYAPKDLAVKERKMRNVAFGLSLGGSAMVISSIPLLTSAKKADAESARTLRGYGFALMGIGSASMTISIPLYSTARNLK